MNEKWFEQDIPRGWVELADRLIEGFAKTGQSAKLEALARIRKDQDDVQFLWNQEACLVGIYPKNMRDAFFGYWGGSPNIEAHAALFEAVANEARNNGFDKLIGPINFNTYHPYRIRLQEPTNWSAFTGEPVNPVYYAQILEQLGFKKERTYFSHYIDEQAVKVVYDRQEQYLKVLNELPYNFIPVNEQFWNEHLERIFELIQDVFEGNAHYRGVGIEEFRLDHGKEFGALLCPHTSVIFEEPTTKEWAAISLCMPNYQELELTQHEFRFDRDYNQLKRKTFLAKTVGVHPNYRNKHLMRYLAAYGMVKFPQYYEDAIFCLMREDNISNSFTARINKESVSYALYGQDLNA